MADEWKQLYRTAIPAEAEHNGPLLFYNDLVVDHCNNPRNVGVLENPDGMGTVGDPACGDQMKVYIQVRHERIVDIRFQSSGCAGTIAASSMMTELAMGKTLSEARMLTDDDVIVALGGVPEKKKMCSLMGTSGLQEAIQDYLSKTKTV